MPFLMQDLTSFASDFAFIQSCSVCKKLICFVADKFTLFAVL